MIYDLKTIALSFMNLKEKVGNKELKLTKSIYVGIINIPNNPTYYLILNNTKHKLKVLFENKETISFNSKIFISTDKPKKIFTLHINKEDTAPFATLKDVVKKPVIREEEIILKYINQDILDKYYLESPYLNDNEKHLNYLYKISLDFELLKKIQINQTDFDITLIVDEEKQYRLRYTILHDNILYTNHLNHVLEIIQRIKEYVPT